MCPCSLFDHIMTNTCSAGGASTASSDGCDLLPYIIVSIQAWSASTGIFRCSLQRRHRLVPRLWPTWQDKDRTRHSRTSGSWWERFASEPQVFGNFKLYLILQAHTMLPTDCLLYSVVMFPGSQLTTEREVTCLGTSFFHSELKEVQDSFFTHLSLSLFLSRSPWAVFFFLPPLSSRGGAVFSFVTLALRLDLLARCYHGN